MLQGTEVDGEARLDAATPSRRLAVIDDTNNGVGHARRAHEDRAADGLAVLEVPGRHLQVHDRERAADE